jgi:hypothetical protein
MVNCLTGNSYKYWVQGIHTNYLLKQLYQSLPAILFFIGKRLKLSKAGTNKVKPFLKNDITPCTSGTNVTVC